MSKHKNISNKVKNGTVLQTRDENFEGQGNYKKPGYENKGNYRKAVVVDSNRKDELAVVKLTTSKKGNATSYCNGKTKYRPYILTIDNNSLPIKTGRKFQNSNNKKVSKNDIQLIKKECIKFNANRKKLKKLKNR